MPPPKVLAPAILLTAGLYILTILFLSAFIGTMTFNLPINNTRLGDSLRLKSTLSPFAMTWIMFSNLALTIISLGLFYPWARVRRTRYFTNHMALTGTDTVSDFRETASVGGSAIAEEVAGFFDLDFGL